MNLTFKEEVGWVILPLIMATIIMLIYFEKYDEERPGWNTYVSNSLVLLFISVILFRYIYGLGGGGAINFITYLDKAIISLVLLLIGIVMLFLNFKHFLPEKIAKYLSSPLTLNLLAYIVILRVYSNLNCELETFLSLLIIFLFFLLVFNLIIIILKNLFSKLKKIKEKEDLEQIKQDKKPIQERRKQIKKMEREIKKEEREVVQKEKEIVKEVLKKLDKQKKVGFKLKKEAKK